MYIVSSRLLRRYCILGCLTIGISGISEAAATYITIDVPGAVETMVAGINNNGDVIGTFLTSFGSPAYLSGYLRTADGTLTILSISGATTGVTPDAINDTDVITGIGGPLESSGYLPVFVRAADGTVTFFEIAAGTSPALPLVIDAGGDIAGGYYTATSGIRQGFIRNSAGTITTLGTAVPTGINGSGDAAGTNDYGGLTGDSAVGFVRTAAGDITTFSAVPGPGWLTLAVSINNSQQVAGEADFIPCLEPRVCVALSSVGFLRQPDGTITTFGLPGIGTIHVTGINTSGQIIGFDQIFGKGSHGFVRDGSGVITPLDVPNSSQTSPAGINDAGVIAGTFLDSEGMPHGFIRIP